MFKWCRKKDKEHSRTSIVLQIPLCRYYLSIDIVQETVCTAYYLALTRYMNVTSFWALLLISIGTVQCSHIAAKIKLFFFFPKMMKFCVSMFRIGKLFSVRWRVRKLYLLAMHIFSNLFNTKKLFSVTGKSQLCRLHVNAHFSQTEHHIPFRSTNVMIASYQTCHVELGN